MSQSLINAFAQRLRAAMVLGPFNFTAAANDAGDLDPAGVAWGTDGLDLCLQASGGFSTCLLVVNTVSRYLRVSGISGLDLAGVSLPTSTPVESITFAAKRTSPSPNLADRSVRMFDGDGSTIGPELAKVELWRTGEFPSLYTVESPGLTIADVADPDFGFGVSVQEQDTGTLAQVIHLYVHSIEIEGIQLVGGRIFHLQGESDDTGLPVETGRLPHITFQVISNPQGIHFGAVSQDVTMQVDIYGKRSDGAADVGAIEQLVHERLHDATLVADDHDRAVVVCVSRDIRSVEGRAIRSMSEYRLQATSY